MKLTSAERSFFDRDVECIRRFFRRKYRYEGESWPTWKDVVDDEGESSEMATKRIDVEVGASGYSRELQKELEDVRY